MFHIQTFSSIGTLIISVLVLAFWWWSTRFMALQTSAALSRIIRIIRLVALLCLVLLVANITVTWQQNLKIQPKILVYVDASRSMNSFRTAVTDSVGEIIGQLTGDVVLREFSNQIEPLGGINRFLPDGPFTDLSLPLEDAFLENQSNAVQGAILLSDGAHNSGQRPSLSDVSEPSIPFYPMFIGDSTKYPDMRIEQVQLPRVTYAGDTVIATVTLQTSQISNQTTSSIRVTEGDEVFARKTIQLKPGNYIQEEDVELRFPEAGGYQIQFSADSLSNERDVTNNTRNTYIQVRPSQYSVLLLAENPSIETRFLSQAIGSMDRFALHSHFINMQGSAFDEGDYDIVFTIGRPSNTLGGYSELVSGVSGTIHQVNTLGQIEGQMTNSPVLWNESPVVLSNGDDNALLDIFTWETTWQELPPVWAGRGYQRHSPLLLSANTRQPFISVDENPQGKKVYIYGQHLWRWNFASSPSGNTVESIYADILETLLYFILRESKQDQIQLEISGVDKGQLTAETQVYDLSGRPVTGARVTGTVLDSAGKPYERILFQRDDYSYFATTGISDPGQYRLMAEAINGETVLRDTSDLFTIAGRDAESTMSSGQPETLRNIAEFTGGDVINTIQELPLSRFNAAEPILQNDMRVWHARKSIWLWGLITVALIGDWFIRRRYSIL